MSIRNSILLSFLALGLALSGSVEAKTRPHRAPAAAGENNAFHTVAFL